MSNRLTFYMYDEKQNSEHSVKLINILFINYALVWPTKHFIKVLKR